MGMFDNIKNMFKGTKKEPVVQRDDSYERQMLAEKVVDLVEKIKRKNSFDSSIWNLANASTYTLQRKSLQELESVYGTLSNRLSELDRQSRTGNSQREALEATKWTGQRQSNMTRHDFDRFQNDDGR